MAFVCRSIGLLVVIQPPVQNVAAGGKDVFCFNLGSSDTRAGGLHHLAGILCRAVGSEEYADPGLMRGTPASRVKIEIETGKFECVQCATAACCCNVAFGILLMDLLTNAQGILGVLRGAPHSSTTLLSKFVHLGCEREASTEIVKGIKTGNKSFRQVWNVRKRGTALVPKVASRIMRAMLTARSPAKCGLW